MFILFTFSFGDDFYIAAGVLLGIELIGQILKLFDFSYFFRFFKEKDLVNDSEVQQKLVQATKVINTKFNSMIESGGRGIETQFHKRNTIGKQFKDLQRVI